MLGAQAAERLPDQLRDGERPGGERHHAREGETKPLRRDHGAEVGLGANDDVGPPLVAEP